MSVEWNGQDTFVQSEAILQDYGIFASPDEFFLKYKQHFNPLISFLYAHFGSKMMTKNAAKMRNSFRANN